jgi:hypothetical protein
VRGSRGPSPESEAEEEVEATEEVEAEAGSAGVGSWASSRMGCRGKVCSESRKVMTLISGSCCGRRQREREAGEVRDERGTRTSSFATSGKDSRSMWLARATELGRGPQWTLDTVTPGGISAEARGAADTAVLVVDGVEVSTGAVLAFGDSIDAGLSGDAAVDEGYSFSAFGFVSSAAASFLRFTICVS